MRELVWDEQKNKQKNDSLWQRVTLKMLALKTPYGGQITLLTLLIN